MLNIYATNTRALTFVTEKLLNLRPHTEFDTVIVGNFNTSLSPMDRFARQKQNRDITKQVDVVTQMDLRDIYRTFRPNIKEFTFSAPQGAFSKTDDIWSHKASLNRYKKIKGITSCILLNHHELKESSKQNKLQKAYKHMRKINSQRNYQWVNEEISKEIKDFLEFSENACTTQTYRTQ